MPYKFNPISGQLDYYESSDIESFGNLDGGYPDSEYGGIDPIDAGEP